MTRSSPVQEKNSSRWIYTDFNAFHRGATLLLFFASGFAGLVYEVLWMRELGLLFGNTSQAAATTLAAFFLGLVGGAKYWGRRAGRVPSPLRAYAWLEAGVGLSALLYFLLLDAYHALYSFLFQALEIYPAVFLAVKLLLAMGALFPPSFFMGGTLPMMSQHLVRSTDSLGRTASVLYAVNTLGAALGAYSAGFLLPRHLGFNMSYSVAIATTGMVAGLAWMLGNQASRRNAEPIHQPSGDAEGKVSTRILPPGGIRALAFFSGFCTLSLEVLWTRMFAQVLQNSVYTFATILVTFLVALSMGAAVANGLMRKRYDPERVLLLLLVSSALLVGATPFVFHGLTSGLEYFGGQQDFAGYIVSSFGCASLVMLLPGIILGTQFPYLLRLAEPLSRSVGRTVGDLAAVNTLGAVAGSSAAGFLLLDLFGLWASIRLIAAAYICAAILVGVQQKRVHPKLLFLPVVGLLLLVSLLDPYRLPVVNVDPIERGESLLQVWEGSSGIVSVIRQPTSLNIKLDNDYSLGGTGAAQYEEAQAHLPLLLHPAPRSVFFLGMGTGITAGAALVHSVERVVVSELAPEVVEAARTFFEPYVHGLFEDSRVVVVSEDGRNYLFGTSERFDVIIADLFMPWKAGVGSLYSQEHYRASLSRLRERGLYMQWLPLYQMSQEEFGVVARTMREVFPLVTLWRGTIAPGWETAGLVGHRDPTPLDPEALARRLEQTESIAFRQEPGAEPGSMPTAAMNRLRVRDILVQYCGNVTAAGELLDRYPVNTDDRPIIEYEAPVSHRKNRANQTPWFVGGELLNFLGKLMAAAPLETDTYLKGSTTSELDAVRAGLSLYVAQVMEKAGADERASNAMQQFERLLYGATPERAATNDLEQTRHELRELIEKYEHRIQALREHLRETEEEIQATGGEHSSVREPDFRR